MSEETPRRRRRHRRKKLLRRPWLIILVIAMAAAAGFYLFTGWRARDLASKARKNFEDGNYRMAWLHLRSARDMRPNDAEVLRTSAMIESKFGRPEAMDTILALEERGAFRSEDVESKANIAMRFGTEEQFEQAVQKLEALGGKDNAAPLRANRAALRGDIDRAISEARQSTQTSDNPQVRLELARLLNERYGHALRTLGRPAPEDIPALEEIKEIIGGLQSTELAEVALALGLGAMPADPETKKRWAEAGVKNISASNPALLPSAEFLVRNGAASAQDLHAQLRPVYDNANLAQRADFALWLSRQGMAREALTLITAQEAADDLSAFLARTDALARLSNWQGVLETTESAEKVPDSMRQLTRVWAVVNSGDPVAMRSALSQAVGSAVQAAARERQLRPMLDSLDSIGAGTAANVELERLCANPEVADAAFTLLRERIGRTGGTAALEPVYARALEAAPGAPSVINHGRYLELFRGLRVEPAETTAAIANQPSEIPPRITHALLMLRKNDPAAAKATFDDVTVFFDRMTPSQQTVVAAFTAGTGDIALAKRMRGIIKTDVLTKGERALLDEWVAP